MLITGLLHWESRYCWIQQHHTGRGKKSVKCSTSLEPKCFGL